MIQVFEVSADARHEHRLKSALKQISEFCRIAGRLRTHGGFGVMFRVETRFTREILEFRLMKTGFNNFAINPILARPVECLGNPV